MKITQIECVPVEAPGRTLVPVCVHTDEGLIGVGEAGLQRRWHAIVGVIEHFKPWLIGQDPMRIEHLWQKMFRGGFYPGDRLVGSAVSAIDIALWDIKGQALGAPVYELLGGRCRDYVQCFTGFEYLAGDSETNISELVAAVNEGSADAAADLARHCAGIGHKFFRLGLTHRDELFDARGAVRALVAQLEAVRSAVGDALELMVDLHTRLSPDEAIWFCRQVEPLGMYVVEDPLRSEHAGGYHLVRGHTNVPLAAGEQWAGKWEFRQVIENQLVDYVRPDLCICGGLTEDKKIAAMAETHLIRLLLHNPLGPICTAASLHLDLACDNAGPQEVLFPPAVTLPDVFECAFEFDGATLTAATAPGIGVKFNRQAAQAYPPQMAEPPHPHRQNGSYTNY